MNKKIAQKKLEFLGFPNPKIEKWDIGTNKNCYIVRSENKKFVLKLYPISKKKKIQLLIDRLRKINEKKKITLFPLNKKVISLGNNCGFMYEFFEGKNYSQTKYKNNFELFGSIVGEFTLTAKRISKPSLDSKYLKEEIKLLEWFIPEIKDKKIFDNNVVEILQKSKYIANNELKNLKFPSQIIHGDIHMDNVLYNEKNKSYLIIDIDGIRNRPRICDIVVIISYSLTKNKKNNVKVIKSIMEGYSSKVKLTKKEKTSLPFFMIPRKIGELVFLYSQRNKKILSEKEFRRFSKGSLDKLKIIIDQYDYLVKLFEKM